MLEQHRRLVAVGRCERDADARAHRNFLAADGHRQADEAQDLAGDLRHVARGADATEHDDELVSAEPCNRVGTAHAGAQSLAHRGQQLVTRRMAEHVIDILETVEIDEQHGKLRLVALGVRKLQGHAVQQEQAIGQARQRIVLGLIHQLLFARAGSQGNLDAIAQRTRMLDDRVRQAVIPGRADDHNHPPLVADAGAQRATVRRAEAPHQRD